MYRATGHPNNKIEIKTKIKQTVMMTTTFFGPD